MTKLERVKMLNKDLKKLFYLGRELLKLVEDEYDLSYELHNVVSLLQNEETRSILFQDNLKDVVNKFNNHDSGDNLYDWYKMQGTLGIDIIKSYILEVDRMFDIYVEFKSDTEILNCHLHGDCPHLITNDGDYCLICIGGGI